MSNEQCCLCGAVGHDSKDCGMMQRTEFFAWLLKAYRQPQQNYTQHNMEVAFAAGWQAARAQPAEQKLTKPVSIGGVRFHIGVDVSHVLRAAERRYEYEQSPEYKARQAERVTQCMAAQPAGEAVAWLIPSASSHGFTLARPHWRGAFPVYRTAPPTQPAPVAGEAVAKVVFQKISETDEYIQVDVFIDPINGYKPKEGDLLYTAPPAQVPDGLREAAKDFYNRTVADKEVIIRCNSAEKRDAVTASGERLRAALAAAPQPKGASDGR